MDKKTPQEIRELTAWLQARWGSQNYTPQTPIHDRFQSALSDGDRRLLAALRIASDK